MSKFIVGTFLILGWAFYEMSGGADFVPEERAVVAEAQTEQPAASVVARAETTDLTDIGPVEPETAEVIEASAVIETAEPAAIEDAVEQVVLIEQVQDIRAIAGSWVNMRSGPGTDFSVLTTLPEGTEAEVLEIDPEGWARIRIVSTQQTGWMAERLLSAS